MYEILTLYLIFVLYLQMLTGDMTSGGKRSKGDTLSVSIEATHQAAVEYNTIHHNNIVE